MKNNAFIHRYAIRITHTAFWVATGTIMQFTHGSSTAAAGIGRWLLKR